MTAGDVVLMAVPEIGGSGRKVRPALILSRLPGTYQSLLMCGISTKIKRIESNWDELIQKSDADFRKSGLRKTSAVRLSFLYAASPPEILTTIGTVGAARLRRLRSRLAKHLQS